MEFLFVVNFIVFYSLLPVSGMNYAAFSPNAIALNPSTDSSIIIYDIPPWLNNEIFSPLYFLRTIIPSNFPCFSPKSVNFMNDCKFSVKTLATPSIHRLMSFLDTFLAILKILEVLRVLGKGSFLQRQDRSAAFHISGSDTGNQSCI